ncbi:MAG: adenosine kinase [Desulfocapsaceae bacterium]|nr:adenosine kinase [Desulfocapsaceae bacterium]
MKNIAKSYVIAGVGSPVVDQVAQVPNSFLETIHGEKGGMELVDEEELAILLASLPKSPISSPGGSAGNTIFALARLGLSTRFIGVVGDDVPGKYYRDAFVMRGGDSSRMLTRKTMPTAQCLSLVTPDGERTMRTHLGAAASLAIEDISSKDFSGCNHVHLEGYLLFNQELMRHILKEAKGSGCTVSIDLASFEVVHAAGQLLPELLDEYVDMVFANEEEAEAFAGTDNPETCLAELSKYADLVAIKYGAEGAVIHRGEETCRVAAVPVREVVDTTGAGDMWAAGFLFGLGNGKPLEQCGNFGSMLGAAVVQQQGTDIPEVQWNLVLEQLEG